MKAPLLLAFCAAVVACAAAEPGRSSVAPGGAAAPASSAAGAEAHAVGVVLDDWHDAAARADEGRYFDHLAADSVFLGTDATERWTKDAFRAFAHPHFARGKAWSFRSVRRTIDVEGRYAFFDELLETPNLGPCRGSGVARREDGGPWRVLRYDLSFTIPNERASAVKALLEGGAEPPAPKRPQAGP